MKYLRFEIEGAEKQGVVEGGVIKEITGDIFTSYEYTGSEFEFDGAHILAPVQPKKIVAVGKNYLDHIGELGGDTDIPKNPIIFIKMPHTIVGPGEIIKRPKGAKRVDYEAELGIVIGKECFNVEPEQAMEYVFGATCLNDVTERVFQKSDKQWIRSKNFPTFCPVGPYIVTGLDYGNLNISSKLNGEIRQNSNTSKFLFNLPELISFISGFMPMYPGDVIATGTPEGIGAMVEGDVVEVTVEGVGTLRNKVADA
ncbi:MAG: fumarylacetoacetate hydrolase family protein [Christensenellales bacterium]|jgi:2-keto-4-pentenoate hydratase/2-oxohepta-3-ene-1,7-dioic acid hydratase in catechol pathway